MKKRKDSGRVIFTSAVLLVLVVAAAWTLKVKGQRKEQPVTAETETQQPSAEMEIQTPQTEEPKVEPEEPPADESGEEGAVKGQEGFVTDYTSRPLLETTPIKCLTLQVGTTAGELRFNWMSPDSQAGKVVWTNNESGESVSFDAQCEASTTMPGYYVNKAVATDIEAGQTYTYKVGNDNAWSPEYEYTFPASEGNNYTFLAVSDVQIGQSQQEEMQVTVDTWDKVVNRLRTEVPEALFLVHAGDQVSEYGNAEQYDGFLNHLGLYQIPMAPVVGNHDVPYGGSLEKLGYPAGPYFYEHFNVPNRSEHYGMSEYDKDGDYWFERRGTLFIVLNSSTIDFTESHREYVERVVEEHSGARWKVLIQHYPPFSGVEGNREKMDGKLTNYMARMAALKGIDLVITGHDHVYARSKFIDRHKDVLSEYDYASGATAVNPEGVLYLNCGTGSGCMYGAASLEDHLAVVGGTEAPTAIRIDVTDEEMHIRAYAVDSWTVFDEYTIRKE